MASGHKPAGKPAKRKVTHIHIKPAAGNGRIVHHELEPVKTRQAGGGMMPTFERDPQPTVFSGPKAHKQMMAHVDDLAQQMGGEDEAGEAGATAQTAMA